MNLLGELKQVNFRIGCRLYLLTVDKSLNTMLKSSLRPLLFPLIFTLSGSSVYAQSLDSKLSYECEPTTVAKVLASLSEKSKVLLRTSKGTESQVVQIRATDKPLREIMNRLAEATGAEWAQESDGYRLTRSSTLANKQKGEELQDRIKRMQDAIGQLVAEANKLEVFDRQAAQKYVDQARAAMNSVMNGVSSGRINVGSTVRQFNSYNAGSPSGRAIAKLLQLMSIADLAALAPGTRTVYATSPTQMQRPLPAGTEKIISKFIEEQKVLSEAANSGASPQNPMMSAVFGGQVGEGSPAKTIMVVSRFGATESLTLQIIVANVSGNSIATGFSAISPSPASIVASFQSSQPNDEVKFSELSKQFAKLVKDGMGTMGAVFVALSGGGGDQTVTLAPSDQGAPAQNLATDWKKRILHPDQYEPLSVVVNDAVRSISEGEKSDFVACLTDDSLIPMSRSLAEGPLKVGIAAKRIQEEWGLEVAKSGGWLVFSPRDPSSARDQQLNRPGLAKMLQALDAKGWLTLDEKAAYATSQPLSTPLFAFDNFFTRLINRTYADREMGRNFSGQREMLRFYALIGPSQRQALNTGRPVPIAGLTGEQLGLLRSMVFNSPDGPRVNIPQSQQPNQGPPQRQRGVQFGGGAFMMMGGQNLREERTEALPTGLPTNGTVVLRTSRQPAVFASQQAASGGRTFTASELGMQRAMSSRTDLPAMFANQQSFDRYLYGAQVDYDFAFQFTQQTSLDRSLTDYAFDAAAQPGPYDALPQVFRNNVDRATTAGTRMAMPRIPVQQGGGATPPPHP